MFSCSPPIFEKKYYDKNEKTAPIKIQATKSVAPHIPNSPSPFNTPPNLEILRELYLGYLAKINKK